MKKISQVFLFWSVAVFALFINYGLFAKSALVVFDSKFDVSTISATDSQFEMKKGKDGNVLSVTVLTNHQYPGITIKAPQNKWDLSQYEYVEVMVKNSGASQFSLNCRVDNPGADGKNNCVTANVTIPPGETRPIRVRLNRYGDDKMDGKLFGMRGYPKKYGGPYTVNPSNIVQVLLFIFKPSIEHSFDVQSIIADGQHIPPTALTSDANPFFPFIDTFGQYKHKNWNGKTLSIQDLQAKRKSEEKELTSEPEGLDKYGGWAKGPKFQATGFFRTQKVKGKWWLVDPDGNLFFSHGIDCVRMTDSTPIEERESWFENPPWQSPEFQGFISRGRAIKDYYANRTVKCFPFAGANLVRKYGENWRQIYSDLMHKRLRSWGLNTIGNWSDEQVRLMRKTAYTDSIGSGRTPPIQGSEGYWGKFPDVFDPSFKRNLKESMASKKGKSAGDPWCIGYFSDNEMSWGDEYSLSIGALKSPTEQPAKKVFIENLKAKYNSIEALNKVWGTKYESWEELSKSQNAPDKTKAKDDLLSFYTTIAEEYFKTVRETIKEVAPQQLYLGCRFAWVNQLAAKAAAKYCDVVSYNIYRRDVRDFKFNGEADVPLIIGEFHFGHLTEECFIPDLFRPHHRKRGRRHI